MSRVLQSLEELFVIYKERHATTVEMDMGGGNWLNLLTQLLECNPKPIGLNVKGNDKNAHLY